MGVGGGGWGAEEVKNREGEAKVKTMGGGGRQEFYMKGEGGL